jgi:hypothetical protein
MNSTKRAIFLALILATLSFAAFSQENEKVKLMGQIVCSGCWDEADRSKVEYGTLADFECAETCAEKGIGQALAVKDYNGNFTLYLLEDGRFDKKAENWLAYIAKNAEIKGSIREADGKKYLRVDEISVIKPKKMPMKKKKKAAR